MSEFSFILSPEIPAWLAAIGAVAVLLFCLPGLLAQVRGSWIRLTIGLLVALALFNPTLLREDRDPLKTVVPLVIDQTGSQRFGDRMAQTEQAVEEIKAQLGKLEQFELREIRVKDRISTTSDVSTALFGALESILTDVPLEQRGGALFITDGQVHDVPESADAVPVGGPLHVFLTGEDDERDRRITLTNAPRYGVVGEPLEVLFRVDDTGIAGSGGFVEVTISLDGEVIAIEEIETGMENSFVLEVPHGGKNILELRAKLAEDEISEVNNLAFTTINGIRENLRVLLVSGEPHAGERTWRNLLKSDASVDLVHFTILRPPEKQDGTPINELSLIAFPTRELFVQKIDEFDLIIFDRYKRRGVLPVLYFDNIARYVQDGGAVLIAAGPEYAEAGSIANTPLNAVLPAISSGEIFEQPFYPQVSELGRRHPVTRKLDGWDPEQPDWSRWFRSIAVKNRSGETLMTDNNDEPVLMLERVGEGRVALFLSDHVWLWARGFEGGGPYGQLLRRLAHWLMKEPELDEERLTATAVDNRLSIRRQTLGESTDPVTMITPSGETSSLELTFREDGLWQAEVAVEETGLYRIENGDLTSLAQVGPANRREFAEVISTGEKLRPIADEMDGSIRRVAGTAIPRIVAVSSSQTASGRGWIGLVDTDASVLIGIDRFPLFSGFLGLALLLASLSSMWFREGR